MGYYKKAPHYVYRKVNNKVELWSLLGQMSYVKARDLTPITNMPTFALGDRVVCVKHDSPYYQKIMTITDKYPGVYRPYNIADEWVTPFDIVTINY